MRNVHYVLFFVTKSKSDKNHDSYKIYMKQKMNLLKDFSN